MHKARADEIKRLYHDEFRNRRDEVWFSNYRNALNEVAAADEATFKSPEFQARLWENNAVSSLGPGNAVTVKGAYDDPVVAEALWRLRQDALPQDVLERARSRDAQFEKIIALVTPKYNQNRPSARLARLFAMLQPNDVHCLVDWTKTAKFRGWLGLSLQKLGIIGQHVMSRQALREVLGPEATLDDRILYGQFAWFVWERIEREKNEGPDVAIAPPSPTPTDIPRLAMLPARSQRKGINYVADNLTLLVSILHAAEHGIDRPTLDQLIAEEAPQLKNNSRSNLMSQAATLGLLSMDNGTYRPTALGKDLLEGSPPAEILTPVMVRSIFGFAQILDDLGREQSLTRSKIARLCREYYPRWTSDFAPNQLVAWMRDLRLVTVEGVGANANVSLTEEGDYWRTGLPDTIKNADFLLSDERPDEKTAEEEEAAHLPEPAAFVEAPFHQILDAFRQQDDLRLLVFSEDQIALIHAGLHASRSKRFILLAGLSGTGKTSMASGYARAYCMASGLPFDQHYEQVAVWPDWTDPTGLLGFINPLADPPSFQETRALRLVLSATQNPSRPYFLCLDEMNLARVEHYFAPFLSAMEGSNGRLALHQGRDLIDAVPPSVPWPRNLFIIGTVNMDETTHPFSDKVLDRAFTFEFWQVDLDAWRRSAEGRGASVAVLAQLYPVLEDFKAALEPARRHFGYRTCDEILGFVSAANPDSRNVAIDAALLAKVLPKVRGEAGGALEKAVAHGIELCSKYGLPQSRGKLSEMQAKLQSMGFVRFWS